jgi:hypothetical protein
MREIDLGDLSPVERTYMDSCRPMAADMIAFLDAQRVTIGPPVTGRGAGWLIAWDGAAHVFTAWGADQKPKVERRCATMDEALRAAHAYEHMLPTPQ